MMQSLIGAIVSRADTTEPGRDARIILDALGKRLMAWRQRNWQPSS